MKQLFYALHIKQIGRPADAALPVPPEAPAGPAVQIFGLDAACPVLFPGKLR